MAFWRMGNGFASSSAIDKLLDKPDHTLIEVLEEPDLLQELLAPNTKLVEYLREPEILQELVGLVADSSFISPQTSDISVEDIPKESDEVTSSNDVKEAPEDENDENVSSSNDPSPDDTHEHDEHIDSTTLQFKESDDTTKPNASDSTPSEELDQEQENANGLASKEDESNGLASDENENENENDNDDDDENNQSYFDDEESRQHFANIASEILSSDVWSITEALMENLHLIDVIWAILDYPIPLGMAHASYFTKINEHLLDKKTDEMLFFIKGQDNFVERFMRHIDNPPLMDFLLKVISSDKPDNSTGIIEFLQHQKLISSLVALLGPEASSSVQAAAGDFLKAFVTISANSNSDNTTIGPNELSRELVSEPCIRELVRLMLFGGSGLATGVGVVIEIIRKNNSDYDFVPVMYTTLESHPPTSRDPIYLGHLVKIFSENIPKFNALLVKKHDDILKTPFGQIEPLGFERFKICELVAELLHCSNMTLLNHASGEAIVRARDLERIRVRKHLAETTGGYPPLEYPELLVESTEAAEKKEESESEKNVEEKVNSESGKDDDPRNELADDLSSLSLEKTSDSDDGTKPPPDESSLRSDPVVGDRLKIALVDNQIITHILNMFFQFPWNNFLHNVVFDIVQQVLNGPMVEGYNRYLAIDLFKTGRLTYLICEGQKTCAEYQAKTKCRLGYMGHLTLISEEVVKFTAVYKPETISPVIEEVVQDPEWVAYVSETLTRTREQYNSILGGQRPEDSPSHINPDAIILRNDEIPIELENNYEDQQDGDDDDYLKDEEDIEDEDKIDKKDGSDEGGSDKFSRYVSEQMTNSDQFGSSDEEEDDDDEWAREKAAGYLPYQPLKKESSSDRAYEPESSNRVQLLGSHDDLENEDEDGDEEVEDDDDDDDLGLVRSKSYNEMNWDPEVTQKIVDTIKYIRDS